MGEARGGRTNRRQANLRPAGFDDRDDHRTACASPCIINKLHTDTSYHCIRSLARQQATTFRQRLSVVLPWIVIRSFREEETVSYRNIFAYNQFPICENR